MNTPFLSSALRFRRDKTAPKVDSRLMRDRRGEIAHSWEGTEVSEELYLQMPFTSQEATPGGRVPLFGTESGKRTLLERQIEDPLGGKKSFPVFQKAVWLVFLYL